MPSVDADPRWRDIADNSYSNSFQAGFDYANATAVLRYEETGSTFTGSFIADGLKPNFAYQMKFRAGHDSPGMERLGYLGRWWFGGNPLNVSDAYYEAHKTDPICSSFMLFDYFATDSNGHIEKPIAIDSTYHVLWRYGISGVPGVMLPSANDGPSLQTLVDPVTGSAYDVDHDPHLVSVFGEYEHTAGSVRPLPGQLVMPDGYYELEFVLTEESFHSSGGLGGWWSEAMVSPTGEAVRFTIDRSAGVPEPASLALLFLSMTPLLRRRRR